MRVPKLPKERMFLMAVQQIESPGFTSPGFKLVAGKWRRYPKLFR
ncbi:MAG: hypothetical protein ABJA66_10705 [Actinomycetota bacterium]